MGKPSTRCGRAWRGKHWLLPVAYDPQHRLQFGVSHAHRPNLWIAFGDTGVACGSWPGSKNMCWNSMSLSVDRRTDLPPRCQQRFAVEAMTEHHHITIHNTGVICTIARIMFETRTCGYTYMFFLVYTWSCVASSLQRGSRFALCNVAQRLSSHSHVWACAQPFLAQGRRTHLTAPVRFSRHDGACRN